MRMFVEFTVLKCVGADGKPLVDIMQMAGEDPPVVGVKILCRHPFMENKRAYVTPSSVVPLLSKIWDGPEGGLKTAIKPLKEVSCPNLLLCSLPQTLILVWLCSCLSVCLPVCLFVCLSFVCLSVCLSVCLPVWEPCFEMNFSYIDSTFGMWSPFQPLIQRIISSLSPFLTLSISLSLSLCLLVILPVSRLLSLLATLCSLLFYITHCMLSLSLLFWLSSSPSLSPSVSL